MEGEGALAHVDQTLGYPDHEKVVGVLGVVLGELEKGKNHRKLAVRFVFNTLMVAVMVGSPSFASYEAKMLEFSSNALFTKHCS